MSKELGTLVIVVLKAQHLIDNHTFYKQDPYAKLSLSGGTKQTPVDPKGGQHPVWDAELRFPISKDPSKSNRTITISVWSQEKKDDELLGEGSLDITDTLKCGEFDDWVPLSLNGTQRGEVYLEMTFFAAGPAPLTRRPSKFTNPAERLSRPLQPAAQQRLRVASQSSPSPLSPEGQGAWATNSYEGAQVGSRQARPQVQQVRLPGAWPGPSGQQHQPTQPAAPSHLNRRTSKSEDAPLPPLPPDAEPKGQAVPSILRPGEPYRTGVHPVPGTRVAAPDAPGPERYSAGSPSHQSANGYHHMSPSDIYQPHAIQRDTPPPTGSLPLHAHVHSPPPTQLRAQQLAYPTPEHVFSPGGHGVAPPSTQPQPELAYAQYHSQSPPTPPHQRQQGHHSPRQQAQTLAGHPGHGTAPHLPDNHSTQPYAVPPGSTLLAQPYSKSSSPAPPPRSYVPSQAPSPPVLSHIVTQPPVLVPHARPYTANVSPVLSVRPQVASPGPGPSVPPTQSYFTSSSSISPAQPYAPTPAPSVQPYAPTSVPPAQTYVSPTSSALSPPIHPRPQSTTPSPPVLPYISPPNSIFPLPTSPPPMAPYGPSYTPGPMLSFPTPSFPVPQATAHHENPAVAPFPFGEPEPDLHDPYLLKRYQTPLPLPPGASHAHASGHHAKQNPRPSPPVAAAPAAVSTRRVERESESERAARELQRLEEESARVRREQEERDAELARTLDLELNMDREAESAPPDGPGRPSRRVPPLRT